jgi:hypothetical protein
MEFSGEPISEVGDPPSSGSEDADTMDISDEPGPEVGELPPTWPPLFVSSSARSGSTFSPFARGGDSSTMRCSPDSEVSPAASPKDNKAAPSVRSRSNKTKNRHKMGDDAGNSFPRLHPWASLPRVFGVLARSSKSAGSSVFCVYNFCLLREVRTIWMHQRMPTK